MKKIKLFNIKKTIILVITVAILFYTLTNEKILANVAIPEKDAIVISIFIIISSLCMRFISLMENKKLEKKILRQHAQMQTIINATPLIMYLKDTKGKILLSNNNYAELFGIVPDKIVGKNSYTLYKDCNPQTNEDIEIIQNKKAMIIERQVQLSNGKLEWIRAIKAPVLNAENEVTEIAVIFQNIDNEKEIEERKNTFIATLTHDLKTPTTAQIRALDLLLGNMFGTLNNEQKDIVNQIKQSCKYMNDLIFTILDTYLYDSGQTKICPKSFDIGELISETIHDLSHLIMEKKQDVITKYNITSNKIVADRFQLKRVFVNLIANAINYGFKESAIKIILDETDTEIILKVQNKGKYIPQEKLAEMYEKFKKTENAKFRETSTGLGLYLSKQIIDAHNGKVFAHSFEDDTCIFGFSLPKIISENKQNLQFQPYV